MSNLLFNNEKEAIESILSILLAVATGTKITPELNQVFKDIRKYLLTTKYSTSLPLFIRNSIELSQFWSFIKTESDTYQGRRDFLSTKFRPFLDDGMHVYSVLYHVQIILKSNAQILYETDLASADIEEIAQTYVNGGELVFGGKRINIEDIDVITIAKSNLKFQQLLEFEELNFTDFTKKMVDLRKPVFDKLEVVTNKFINRVPSLISNIATIQNMSNIKTTIPKKVFIVHGRDESLIHEVQNLLLRQNIEGVVLNQNINQGRTIIEKLIDLAKDPEVGFAIVLYTPDDLGQIDPLLESTSESKARARQNVIFEHGLLVGLLGRQKVVALTKSDQPIEMPNDLSGVIYESYCYPNWKINILRELQEQGFEIDFSRIV